MIQRLVRGVPLLLAILAWPFVAHAEHEPDHRYIVLGYVKDGAGRPLAGVEVTVVREKTGLAYPVQTDRQGFYLVIVHMHDEDLGNVLKVTAGGATGRITATFDPKDHRVERGTRVDILGGRLVEKRALFAKTLRQFLEQ